MYNHVRNCVRYEEAIWLKQLKKDFAWSIDIIFSSIAIQELGSIRNSFNYTLESQ